MKKIRSKKKKSAVVNVAFTVLGTTVLLSISAWSAGLFPTSMTSRQKAKDEETLSHRKENLRTATIAIENRTSGMEVVTLEKHLEQNLLVLILKNSYPKPVTGYKFSVGDSIEYTERSNHKLLPGEEVREFVPLQVGLDVKGIKILAVIFDDETTAGDPQFVKEIEDRRKGSRTQRAHALRLLQEAANSPDVDLDNALSTVDSRLPALSPQELSGLSADMVAGISSERYVILQELHRIRTMPSSQGRATETKSSSAEPSMREGLNDLIDKLSRP